MSHQIITDLNQRYTVKKYDVTKRVSQQDMTVILEALRLSASSINSQPWKFIVLESDEAKQKFQQTFANKHQFNQEHATQASHIVLFAHKPDYNKDDYRKVVDLEVSTGRLPAENHQDMLDRAYGFVELYTDEHGYNGHWTKAQSYIALGNVLHTLARLNIGSTCMEGVDSELIGDLFKDQLAGYECNFALAIGYSLESEDYNFGKPKARFDKEDVITVL